jgi:hypothetical protein
MYVVMFLMGMVLCHILYSVAAWVVRFRATYDPETEKAMREGVKYRRNKALDYERSGYSVLGRDEWSALRTMQRRLYRLQVAKKVCKVDAADLGSGESFFPY